MTFTKESSADKANTISLQHVPLNPLLVLEFNVLLISCSLCLLPPLLLSMALALADVVAPSLVSDRDLWLF